MYEPVVSFIGITHPPTSTVDDIRKIVTTFVRLLQHRRTFSTEFILTLFQCLGVVGGDEGLYFAACAVQRAFSRSNVTQTS